MFLPARWLEAIPARFRPFTPKTSTQSEKTAVSGRNDPSRPAVECRLTIRTDDHDYTGRPIAQVIITGPHHTAAMAFHTSAATAFAEAVTAYHTRHHPITCHFTAETALQLAQATLTQHHRTPSTPPQPPQGTS